MRAQLPILMIIFPLIMALIAPLMAYLSTRLLKVMVIGALFASFVSALAALSHVLTHGAWHYHFGGWQPPWGIEYVIDPLSASMAVLISFISLVVAIYSWSFFTENSPFRKGIIYALYCLLITGLMGMVLTGDLFNLYVSLEISSLAAYALIALGGPKAAVAAFRYLLIGTVGASFYLLGVGYLYAMTGTLNMADLMQKLPPLMDSPTVVIAIALLAVGLGIKMALFPMHGWLPDAHAYAPTPISAILSGIMIKVPAYALFRIYYYLFAAVAQPVSSSLTIIGTIGAIGIIYGSIKAMTQKEIKSLLAYSSIAQIGYIAVGLSLGNVYGLIGALFHILNHAIMKTCLFLIAGGVKWKTGAHTIEHYAELARRLPLTMGAFLLAAFSMVGLPPTAGFFSKWYLVLGAMEGGKWPYIVVIILSSLLNAIYFFRIIEYAYMKKATHTETLQKSSLELPATMLVPILLLGVGILALGLLNEPIITKILYFALPGGVR